MTKNTVQRLLVFLLGVPLFILTVLYFNFARNILLVLLVAFVQILAVGETASFFSKKGISVNRIFLTIICVATSAIVYLAPWLAELFPSGSSTLLVFFGFAALMFLSTLGLYAFSKKDQFEFILSSLTASVFIYLYCGVLGAFLVVITSCFAESVAPVLTFTLMTFGNDSLAWLVGMSLGKRRGIVPVSPGKSLAGFIGGFAGSIVAAALSFVVFGSGSFGNLPGLLALGLLIGAAAIIGDLVESALKRSVGVKDSSSIVPGRGGVLDSFDSLLFSAPIFVIFSACMGYFGHLA